MPRFQFGDVTWVQRRNGYQLVRVSVRPQGSGDPYIPMTVAMTETGAYIGPPRTARLLREKYGIVPETLPGKSICTIGFSEVRRKWFGWSHRAIAGFGVGSRVKSGDVLADTFRPGTVAKTLVQAKNMAAAFAEAVG